MDDLVARKSWLMPPAGWDAAVVGSKAAGLSMLPQRWVPTWMVLRRAQPGWESARDACAQLLDMTGARFLMVRSNGPHEQAHPGEGRTRLLAAGSVEEVLGEATHDLAASRWPIVQAAVDPALLGTMSNERRVSQSRARWALEGAVGLGGPEVRTLTPSADTAGDGPLYAESSSQLERQLARVAAFLLARFVDSEVRCEWAWDGGRLWVVQADPQPRLHPGAADDWLARRTALPTFSRSLSPAGDVGGPKANSLRLFAELNLPAVRTVAISGRRWRDGLTNDILAHAGLEASTASPLSARTDSRDTEHQLLLPTSRACHSSRALQQFMSQAAARLDNAKVDDRDWAFLVAPWVDARAGAWVRARPAGGSVEIDAIWGHSDGLHVLPHDHLVVDMNGRDAFVEYVRYKSLLLRGDAESWRYESLGPDWDWRPCLTVGEAVRAAEWCQLLADHLQSATQLLVLAAINGHRSPQAMLPLYHLPIDVSVEQSARRSAVAAVSSPSDVSSVPEGTMAVALRLPPDRLRDTSLLMRIAEACRSAGLPIVVEGSQLGHTFYLLRAAGAEVVGPDPFAGGSGDWVTCLVHSERSLSRIVALEARQALRLARNQLRAAEGVGDEAAAGQARWSLARVQAIADGLTSPTRLSDLPVFADEAVKAVAEIERDVCGQALAHPV